MKKDLAWMSQPFAHRGAHDVSNNIVENTRSSVQAALDLQCGFEVDLRAASCGTIMVFHDDRLERLTHATGRFDERTCAQLQQLRFRDTSDQMMSLQDLLDLNKGRVPMLLEIKSNWHFDTHRQHQFVAKMIDTLKDYHGDFAIMSFDPAFPRLFRQLAPHIPRGLVSEQFQAHEEWKSLSWRQRMGLRFLSSAPHSRPDFIAYDIGALPAIAPMIARGLFKRPLLTWTVRTKQQQVRAQKYCDAMICEGFVPANNKMTPPS